MTTNGETPTAMLTKKDFTSDQVVRWCPGCGDYAILAQVQKIMPTLGIAKENVVFISGIGCASRFPYYMNTYGMHTIHGRAPSVATGLKVAQPDLSVWVITGDGDALSIGGNHLLHVLRRNVDINILLFNNRVYGLTKGQYSPTSPTGHQTKSSPMGSLDEPLNPISVALSAQASFVARTVDTHVKHLGSILQRAAAHKGTSFVEILQNCVIFNDHTWEEVESAKTRADFAVELEHGKPLVFGKQKNKGVRLNGLSLEVVELTSKEQEAQLLVHDEQTTTSLPYLLGQMSLPDYPIPLGVFRALERPTYEEGVLKQVESAQALKGPGDLKDLYHQADTWEVK